MVPEKSNIRGEPKLARLRNPEIKPKMNSELNTTLLQAGMAAQLNPVVGYYREKDPVARPTDSGKGQTHEPVAEVARLTSVAIAATSEKEVERKFDKLRKELEAMTEFIKDKNNIHKELKQMVRSAARRLKEYDEVRRKGVVKEVKPFKDRATQTSSIFKKRGAPLPGRRESPSPLSMPKAKKAKEDNESPPNGELPQHPEPEWTNVIKRGKMPNGGKREVQGAPDTRGQVKTVVKTKAKHARPDAIKIKASEGVAYADILKRVKATPDLMAVGERVTRIRRTREGELLMELGKAGTETSVLQRAIASKLNESAAVTMLTHKEKVIIMDLDEATTAMEVTEAISQVTGPDCVTSGDITLRKSYRGTQAAIILLPYASASLLTKAGKLKIGWVNCRVRYFVARCYRCSETGHLAKSCKNTVEFAALCFKCRKEGHKVADCPVGKKLALPVDPRKENG